jgi:enolase
MKEYGIDTEKEIQDILVKELAKSINAEIIKTIFSKRLKRTEKINRIFK